ncbi:MAG: hypothetical protein M3160_10055 [Candidatus Eremiobacteraeota bacterium]|nr:hypothetical protein [Candidatus Eremiobacteraeota bacterium]
MGPIPDMAPEVANQANGKVARPLRLFVVLVMIVAGLWTLDWSLEKTELMELRDEAHRHIFGRVAFAQGRQAGTRR